MSRLQRPCGVGLQRAAGPDRPTETGNGSEAKWALELTAPTWALRNWPFSWKTSPAYRQPRHGLVLRQPGKITWEVNQIPILAPRSYHRPRRVGSAPLPAAPGAPVGPRPDHGQPAARPWTAARHPPVSAVSPLSAPQVT